MVTIHRIHGELTFYIIRVAQSFIIMRLSYDTEAVDRYPLLKLHISTEP